MMMPLWTTENSQVGSDLFPGEEECQRVVLKKSRLDPRVAISGSGVYWSVLPVRVAVQARGGAVGGPPGVGDTGM